jgi:UDP-galactopyranose mutase
MSASHFHDVDVLVVGAGFAGAIMAERIATELELRVLVVDRRSHVAGNAFDERDAHGILVHRFGPHLFHTNAPAVVDYLSRFTEWWPYEHRVLADVEGQLLPVPINIDTVNRLFGLAHDESTFPAWLEAQAEPIEFVRTAEDAVIARMGRAIYETFFRGYTRKQWGVDPIELDASVTARIPVRGNHDDRYFTDAFQALPRDGYTAMFERILDHPLIEVHLGVDFAEIDELVSRTHTVYTGPIDEYFDNCFGPLPYRSLQFDFRTVDTLDGGTVHPVGQLNFPAEAVRYTRITEFRHFAPAEARAVSTLAYEYPSSEGDPFYPVPARTNRERYHRYERLAAGHPEVTFVGRLASYKYLNMDQVVAQTLKTFRDRAALIGASARTARGLAA